MTVCVDGLQASLADWAGGPAAPAPLTLLSLSTQVLFPVWEADVDPTPWFSGSRRPPTEKTSFISAPRGHTALAHLFPLRAIQGGRRRGSPTIALSPAAELDILKARPRQGKWHQEIRNAEGGKGKRSHLLLTSAPGGASPGSASLVPPMTLGRRECRKGWP